MLMCISIFFVGWDRSRLSQYVAKEALEASSRIAIFAALLEVLFTKSTDMLSTRGTPQSPR
jgi:hypothetical protein